MISVLIVRLESTEQGTFGKLHVFNGDKHILELFTGELPWRENKRGVSCIPNGTYQCTPYKSNKYPNHYKVQNVLGREAILIHEGNLCGDVQKGYLTNVQGCILLGTALGTINNQKAVLSSRKAMSKFRDVIGQNRFTLKVCDVRNS